MIKNNYCYINAKLVKLGKIIPTLLLTDRANVAASKQRKTKQALIPETLKKYCEQVVYNILKHRKIEYLRKLNKLKAKRLILNNQDSIS